MLQYLQMGGRAHVWGVRGPTHRCQRRHRQAASAQLLRTLATCSSAACCASRRPPMNGTQGRPAPRRCCRGRGSVLACRRRRFGARCTARPSRCSPGCLPQLSARAIRLKQDLQPDARCGRAQKSAHRGTPQRVKESSRTASSKIRSATNSRQTHEGGQGSAASLAPAPLFWLGIAGLFELDRQPFCQSSLRRRTNRHLQAINGAAHASVTTTASALPSC